MKKQKKAIIISYHIFRRLQCQNCEEKQLRKMYWIMIERKKK